MLELVFMLTFLVKSILKERFCNSFKVSSDNAKTLVTKSEKNLARPFRCKKEVLFVLGNIEEKLPVLYLTEVSIYPTCFVEAFHLSSSGQMFR